MRVPRFLWVPFELGRPFGAPNEPAFQRRVLHGALRLLERTDGPPVLEDFANDAPEAAPGNGSGGEAAAEEPWSCPVSFRPPATAAVGAPTLGAEVERELALLAPWFDRAGRPQPAEQRPHQPRRARSPGGRGRGHRRRARRAGRGRPGAAHPSRLRRPTRLVPDGGGPATGTADLGRAQPLVLERDRSRPSHRPGRRRSLGRRGSSCSGARSCRSRPSSLPATAESGGRAHRRVSETEPMPSRVAVAVAPTGRAETWVAVPVVTTCPASSVMPRSVR